MITSEENRPHAIPRKVAFSNGEVQQFKLNLRVAQVYYNGRWRRTDDGWRFY